VTPSTAADARAFVASRRRAIDDLREAVRCDHFEPDAVDPSAPRAPFPHPLVLFHVGQALLLDADLRAADGDANGAVAEYVDGLRFACDLAVGDLVQHRSAMALARRATAQLATVALRPGAAIDRAALATKLGAVQAALPSLGPALHRQHTRLLANGAAWVRADATDLAPLDLFDAIEVHRADAALAAFERALAAPTGAHQKAELAAAQESAGASPVATGLSLVAWAEDENLFRARYDDLVTALKRP
jgi:hypothetical protein